MKIKKISLLFFIGVITFAVSGCGKKEENKANEWQNENSYVDINESESNEDLNLSGKLYTDKNKPEGSEEIIIYDCKEKILQIEPHTSYALPENIEIQYLLDTISAHSTGKTMNFKGYLIDNTAIVDIDNRYNFVNWLKNDYLDQYGKYNAPRTDAEKNTGFYCQGFAVNALNAIDKTLKENLGVDTVVFKTNDDKDFLSLGETCNITDGIYFDSEGLPKYLGSIDNYYGEKTFSDLIEEYKKDVPELTKKNQNEQLLIINKMIN